MVKSEAFKDPMRLVDKTVWYKQILVLGGGNFPSPPGHEVCYNICGETITEVAATEWI